MLKKVTREELAIMMKTQKVCKLCSKYFSIRDKGVWDHNHDGGEIRGTLHNSCNIVEGRIKSALNPLKTTAVKEQYLINYLLRNKKAAKGNMGEVRKLAKKEILLLIQHSNTCKLCGEAFISTDKGLWDTLYVNLELHGAVHVLCNKIENKVRFALKHIHRKANWETYISNYSRYVKSGIGLLYPTFIPVAKTDVLKARMRKRNEKSANATANEGDQSKRD